ncbi:MAG: M20 family metallopeptidase, partial [Ruminococcaceae bacterium]|nr:M20 family metallopeptidase [Oscillospiraceae bacterium]
GAHAATQALLEQLRIAGGEVGQEVQCIVTGGASDGNFIAPFGVATLDGCGPCGAGLHTRDEFLLTESVERRFVLMRRLLERLFP